MWRVRQRGEIVSALFILPPGCSPHLFGPCLTFLPAAPMGLVSAGHFPAGFCPSCAESHVIPHPYTDLDSPDLIPFFSMLETQHGVAAVSEEEESDLWAAAHLKPPRPARIIPISWRMAGEGSLAD